MSARRQRPKLNGPAIAELGGSYFVNVAHVIEFGEVDVRAQVARQLGVDETSILVLRALTPRELLLVHRLRLDADTEAWARISARKR